MTDTFYVREVDHKHPGLIPNHPLPRRRELRKNNAIKNGAQTNPGWYRRSVPTLPRVLHSMVSPKRPEPWHDKKLPRAGWVGGRGFPGFTANPQHTFGPSWSVRRMAAPRSAGPAVSPGLPPTHTPHKLFTTQCERNCHTYPWCHNANTNISARAAHPHKTTIVVKPKPTVDKQWRHDEQELRCTDQTHSIGSSEETSPRRLNPIFFFGGEKKWN